MTAPRKPAKNVVPAKRPQERVSRYDHYKANLRKEHASAEGNVKRLDVDIALATANLDALMAERADWADIQNNAAHMINADQFARTIDGQSNGRAAPQISERKTNGEES